MEDSQPCQAKQHEVAATPEDPGRVIPAEIASLFEKPPLLSNEDAEGFHRLLRGVAVAVAPRDVIEWLWIKDVVDLLWEAQRLRRFRSAILIGVRRKALHDVLNECDEPPGLPFMNHARDTLVNSWSAREPKALKEVEKLLSKHGLSEETIFAQALSNKLDDFDRIERLITNADVRRNAALREIDRRRSSLGARLRGVSEEILEAEVVDPASPRPPRSGHELTRPNSG